MWFKEKKKWIFFFDFFRTFKAQIEPPSDFFVNVRVWISNYVMSGIQKPPLHVSISNRFVASAISKKKHSNVGHRVDVKMGKILSIFYNVDTTFIRIILK